MARRILILGAGFGGLELSTMLSDELGDGAEVTLIDKGDSFVFGFSKLDVMFARKSAEAVRLPYAKLTKPGVRLLRQTVTAIDPEARRVTTDVETHEADVLVIALGADYDYDATPGLLEAGNEFYSVAGAERLAGVLPNLTSGRVVIGVCGAPFKCPPAPSEAALLLHDQLMARGVRDRCRITFTIPLPSPVPPSPETSRALIGAFAERDIEFLPGRRIASLDGGRGVVVYEDGEELPYDLFLGVPRHCAAEVVIAGGLTGDEPYIPVEPRTLRTRYSDVYAIGDVAQVGVPKAGVFAEGAARVVANQLIAEEQRGERPDGYDGRGSCYIEFGSGRVGRVDVDFFSGPQPTGTYQEPSSTLVAEKDEFGSSRRARWFGL
ncbi:MAG: NAD(P)/FAD-dependent oxidoreductase [Solirubrobacterales bacterium]